MKDMALRNSILITAQAYATRRDHDGDLICKVLQSIIDSAIILDEAFAIDMPKRRSRKLSSQQGNTP